LGTKFRPNAPVKSEVPRDEEEKEEAAKATCDDTHENPHKKRAHNFEAKENLALMSLGNRIVFTHKIECSISAGNTDVCQSDLLVISG